MFLFKYQGETTSKLFLIRIFLFYRVGDYANYNVAEKPVNQLMFLFHINFDQRYFCVSVRDRHIIMIMCINNFFLCVFWMIKGDHHQSFE